jgi:hypothetical protein
MDKYFVCLANSYKHGGRCIAGIELEWREPHWHIVRTTTGMPKWIRPICRETDTGEIPDELALRIQPLNVVRLSGIEPCVQGAQTENVYYSEMISIEKQYKPSTELFRRLVDETHSHIFYNYGRAVTPTIYQQEGDHSILLIQADDSEVYVDTTIMDKVRYRLRFTHHDHSYDFPITDPDYISLLRQGKKVIGYKGTLFVTCSLGLLHEGWHHKLAVGIYETELSVATSQSFSFDEYEQKLAELLEQKEEIESRIQTIRMRLQQQMEARHLNRFTSQSLDISFHPARMVMQFDSNAFKTDYPDLYEKYCRERKREASITVKRNG